jgi:rRNA-processing protein FCF1
MRRVLLDANALMMPVEVGVRVFDELDRLLGSPSPDAAAGPTGSAGRPPNSSGASRAPIQPGGAATSVESGTAADSGIDGVTLLVPEAVVAELDRLSTGNGAAGTAASVGADLARERCRELDHDASYADDAVCELATDPREVIDYVCTNDRELRERLGARGVPVICLRGHAQLTIQNP